MAKIMCDIHGEQFAVLATEKLNKFIEDKIHSIEIYYVQEELFDDEIITYYFDKDSLQFYSLEPGKIYDDLSDQIRSFMIPICRECFYQFKELKGNCDNK